MTRSAVAAMTAYTLELREAETKLNQNESPWDFPAELKQRLVETVVSRNFNRYPEFEATAFRTALADAYGLAAENILVGNGSNELLAAAVSTFVGPGTSVAIARPTFSLYEKLVTIAGGTVVPVAIDPRSGVLPVEDMQGDVIIVCSPNNPTGGVLPDGGLERLLATGATVLYDRAYGDFAGTGLPPLHERLVTFSTFSKAWGLAALRVGWLAASATTCREIRKVKLPYNLNVISEAAAMLALQNRAYRDANVALIVRERERVFAEMKKTRIEVYPSKANFIAFRVAEILRCAQDDVPRHPEPRRRRRISVFDALLARGVLIRQIAPDFLRVSIGTPAENDAFLTALKEVV